MQYGNKVSEPGTCLTLEEMGGNDGRQVDTTEVDIRERCIMVIMQCVLKVWLEKSIMGIKCGSRAHT